VVQTSRTQFFESVEKKHEHQKELAYSPTKHRHLKLSMQLVKPFPLP
jgi:hypothetical protein